MFPDFAKNIQSTTLLCISGGVDSMVMFDMYLKHNRNIAVCHFNHLIRNDSDNDENLVRDICKTHEIPFHAKRVDVQAYCAETSCSIELGARILRHDFYNTVRKEHGYDFIALAHNADDQAEQVIYSLTRGSGVRGLAGMKEIDEEQKIIRPLLSTFKKDIYEYAHKNNLTWYEDSTNAESDYDRNFIRNEIIPMMETRRTGVKKVLVRTSKYFSEVTDFIDFTTQNWILANYRNLSFNRNIFNNTHKIIRGEILKWIWNGLYKNNFSSKILVEVDRWLKKGQGNTSIYFGDDYFLTLKKNTVYLTKKI